uniref:Uncharacterized protein n=1 Tax=Onchocerca volvulus TaxID=6282 RepID=A0A8R1XSX3_ONCVO
MGDLSWWCGLGVMQCDVIGELDLTIEIREEKIEWKRIWDSTRKKVKYFGQNETTKFQVASKWKAIALRGDFLLSS